MLSLFNDVVMNKLPPKVIILGIAIFIVCIFFLSCFTTVEGGHKGVAITFGNISDQELDEGFHFKAPWTKVLAVDCKNQAESESFRGITLKAQDQLTSRVDITVNWRIDGDFAAEAYRETGGLDGLRDKYLIPKTRSLIREVGKSVKRSEDFFSSDVQIALQDGILTKLKEALSSKGIIIEAVLFRNIELPPSIERGINAKKEMQQEAERAEATLLKFETDQKQKVAQAKAELEAAKTEQEKRRVQADAQAYEIEAKAKAQALSIELEGQARAKAIALEGAALRDNPNLIELRKAEKWDGKLPTTMFGAGQDVMIDLSKMPKK